MIIFGSFWGSNVLEAGVKQVFFLLARLHGKNSVFVASALTLLNTQLSSKKGPNWVQFVRKCASHGGGSAIF